VNGKVERSHKTDSQEFYQGRHFKHRRDLARKLKRWETEYNGDRPHLALKGRTPGERPRELTQSSESPLDSLTLIAQEGLIETY
jgi:transposase InsO family protein